MAGFAGLEECANEQWEASGQIDGSPVEHCACAGVKKQRPECLEAEKAAAASSIAEEPHRDCTIAVDKETSEAARGKGRDGSTEDCEGSESASAGACNDDDSRSVSCSDEQGQAEGEDRASCRRGVDMELPSQSAQADKGPSDRLVRQREGSRGASS